MVRKSVYETSFRKKFYRADILQCIVDVDDAIDFLEEYKQYNLEKKYQSPMSDSERMEISQKKAAIDELEDWLVDKAFEAPVVKNIEKFIYKMNNYAALYAEDTNAYQYFCTMRDVADEIIGDFL